MHRNLTELVDEASPFTTVVCEDCGTLVGEYEDVRPARFDDCPCTMPTLGVPYAQSIIVGGKPYCECPFCGRQFADDDRRLYARHYTAEHVKGVNPEAGKDEA